MAEVFCYMDIVYSLHYRLKHSPLIAKVTMQYLTHPHLLFKNSQ